MAPCDNPWASRDWRPWLGECRDREMEGAASPLDTLDPDLAAVGLNDVSGDGKAKAGSLPRTCLVDAVEALKDARNIVHWNAASRVGNREFYS